MVVIDVVFSYIMCEVCPYISSTQQFRGEILGAKIAIQVGKRGEREGEMKVGQNIIDGR